MASGTDELSHVDPDRHGHRRRPPGRRRRLLLWAVGLVVALAGAALALRWADDETTTAPDAASPDGGDGVVDLDRSDLLGVAELRRSWPGPWVVLRTAPAAGFDRPVVACAPVVSPDPDPAEAMVTWAVNAPPQSDGPAVTEVVVASRDDTGARAAVTRLRGWVTRCPTAVAGGTREAVVLRELPKVSGFVARVRQLSPGSETYQQVAVGRRRSVVVVVAYGEYPGPPGQRPPPTAPLTDALDRAMHKVR